MASITTIPTATVVTVTATIVATIKVTVTATPEPTDPLFVNTNWGALSTVQIAIFLASLIVASLLGFNRMVAIPIFASLCGILDNAMDYYTFVATHTYKIKHRIATVIVADLCWELQDIFVAMYSFFMLQKILTGKGRLTFLLLWSVLMAMYASLRLTMTALHVKTMSLPADEPSLPDYWYPLENKISRGYFTAIAALEIVSAYFLIRVFYRARRASRAAGIDGGGLFTQLAHSSEIRVATLATVGVTRAVCFGFWSDKVRSGFDQTAYTIGNVFPIFLIVDLLATRLSKAHAIIKSGSGYTDGSEGQDQTGGGGSTLRANTLGSVSGKGAVETIQREFPTYAGKGLSGEDCSIEEVSESPEKQSSV